MKLLITGGAGFIGSNFVCTALSKGYGVINVDKLTYAGNLENIGENQSHKSYIFYRVDICNKDKLKEIYKKHQPEVAIHMAAESHVDRSIDCADDFIQTNIVGTYALLDVSLEYFKKIDDKRKKGFRFIHLSTDEVFGTLGQIGTFNSLPGWVKTLAFRRRLQ